MDLLNKEFIHIGTNKIYKELWQNIRMDQTYPFITKPYGGLYCSNINEELCDWLSYVRIEKSKFYDFVSSKPSCIIKLKNNTKLLTLNNKNDIDILKNNNLILNYESNPIIINKYYYNYSISFLPNYEKISILYDVIYINPYIDNTFKEYSIPTLLILNPSAIEYYKPLVKKDEKIIKIEDKKNLLNPSKDYYEYYRYIESLFNETNALDYNLFIKELNTLRDKIISDKNNLYNNLNFNINSDINNQQLLEAITHNIYREKYLLKQKVLHK